MSGQFVYLYNPITGESSGTYVAQLSPMEKNVYLAPTHSTPNPPPLMKAKEVAVFVIDGWVIEPDYRGETWFNSVTGTPTMIENFGQPDVSLVSALPPPPALTPAEQLLATRAAMLPLTAWQVRKVLNLHGLRDAVETAVLASPIDIQDGWRYATEYLRNDSTLDALATQLGITPVQLDAFFVEGATL